MKHALAIIFSVLTVMLYAQQTEQTFRVKKRPVETKKEFPRIFDLKLGGSRDTICGGVMIDLAPAAGYYDSISLFNLRMLKQTFGKDQHILEATNTSGHAIITFYSKQKDGTYKMIYFRNWVIHCQERFSK